jgi:hypothetical protein
MFYIVFGTPRALDMTTFLDLKYNKNGAKYNKNGAKYNKNGA